MKEENSDVKQIQIFVSIKSMIKKYDIETFADKSNPFCCTFFCKNDVWVKFDRFVANKAKLAKSGSF